MSFYVFSLIADIITICLGLAILYVVWKYINGGLCG